MKLSHNAIQVLESRYLLKSKDPDAVETPRQLFNRVATAVAGAEEYFNNQKMMAYWKDRFFMAMNTLQFLPNSPTLMNAGTSLGQLSACFVLPVHDSIEDIFTTLKHTALIQKSGGGTGFNFSELRPKNDFVASTSGNSSGPVSFMKIFDAATENIKQGGKRRGANMGILNCNHPDIEEFIHCKNKGGLSNFNISVGVSDEFMDAVLNNREWTLIHPHAQLKTRKIRAKDIWKQIVDCSWRTGDPGLIFMDTIEMKNPTPELGKIQATNPCGEVPLLPYESCNLGSIDVSKFVNDQLQIEWAKLEEIILTGIRFLDNVIEVNNYPIGETAEMAKGNRKIGLGIMGWAELLIKLNIPYASEEAISLAEKLMKFFNQVSYDASVKLAAERGPFPNWEKSIFFPETRIRNATRTCIAPTGTISIIADTSFSIEPLYALAFRREKVLGNETLIETDDLFLKYLKKHDLFNAGILAKLNRTGVAGSILQLPEQTRNLFKTATEISYEWHLRHQVAFQKYTDNAVSKTINMPRSATKKDVEKAFMTAWTSGTKGITIFRDGSKGEQVLLKGIKSKMDNKSCKVCAS